MGLFSFLFGKKEKLQLNDKDLGMVESFQVEGDSVGWQAQVELWGQKVEVLMRGSREQIEPTEKAALMEVLGDATGTETLVNKALAELYGNADMEYSKWQNHFKLFALAIQGSEVVVTFEENKSHYLFNVIIEKGQCLGTSIDS